ncbi:MAG: hypothetical protein O9338_24100 [Microcystis sp. LE19-251.1A]|nr:hypothetical protein [Microcystis sp. LE19-251.1A]
MNTKLSIILLLLLTVSTVASAQFRHIKGVNSVDLGVGASKYGLHYHGSYVKYFSQKMYGKFTGFYELGSDAGLKFTSIGGDAAVAYNFLKVGEGIYINGIGGLTVAMDKITEGAETFEVDQKLKYGFLFGGEVEFFISDKIVFVIGADQRLVLGADFGNYRAYYRGGLRFNF